MIGRVDEPSREDGTRRRRHRRRAGDLSVVAGVSTTHLAQRFNELIGVTPKRLARTCRFAATVFAINPGRTLDSWPLPAD